MDKTTSTGFTLMTPYFRETRTASDRECYVLYHGEADRETMFLSLVKIVFLFTINIAALMSWFMIIPAVYYVHGLTLGSFGALALAVCLMWAGLLSVEKWLDHG